MKINDNVNINHNDNNAISDNLDIELASGRVNNNIFNDNIKNKNNDNSDNKKINENLERELDLCIRPPLEPRLSHSIIESRFEVGFSLTTWIWMITIKADIGL